MIHLPHTTLTLTAAAIFFAGNPNPSHKPVPRAAHAQSPCSLLTPDQIKAVVGAPVQPGQPGGSQESPDCTWHDAQGHDRVYLSLRDSADFQSTRSQMQVSGHMVPIVGLGENAFFVSSTGSSAALYALKHKHLILLTVDGPNFSKSENEDAERVLAPHILAKF